VLRLGGWVCPISSAALRPPVPLRGWAIIAAWPQACRCVRRRARSKSKQNILSPLARPPRLARGLASARPSCKYYKSPSLQPHRWGLGAEKLAAPIHHYYKSPVGPPRPAGGGGLLADPTQPLISKDSNLKRIFISATGFPGTYSGSPPCQILI
jgi:hypothetical protein